MLSVKECNRGQERQKEDIQKTKSKMADINPTISISLNVNGLNTKIKRQRL